VESATEIGRPSTAHRQGARREVECNDLVDRSQGRALVRALSRSNEGERNLVILSSWHSAAHCECLDVTVSIGLIVDPGSPAIAIWYGVDPDARTT